MVGRIAADDLFDPKAAIIIRNKDELKIPLLLETLPTPKEFADAIGTPSILGNCWCGVRILVNANTVVCGGVELLSPTIIRYANLVITASLSPEQQRFAKAFREMKLSSTLFGIAVIQIKPQLEKLLRLPYGSLCKEIKLTQDLLELFIKYQV